MGPHEAGRYARRRMMKQTATVNRTSISATAR
jgi:hypothetical protein